VIIFDFAGLEARIAELERQTAAPDFWNDNARAQACLKELTGLKARLDPWKALLRRAEDAAALAGLASEEEDEASLKELDSELSTLDSQLSTLETTALLSGEKDDSPAILSINAGAGGTDAQDWVDMLSRMYLRWAEEHGLSAQVVDFTPGEAAGYLSITLLVKGENAHGMLKSETGVHRLVRISPFDSNRRRHTSFASVEVVPEVEAPEIEVRPDDLRIDTFRSSSAGGQHVNVTDSAVRITHIPTGVVAQCQNERSQHQNREVALRILRSKLVDRQMKKQEEEKARVRGEQMAIAWGSQIRSYVVHPYTLVKDHRTGHEVSDVWRVLNGDLDDLIKANLRSSARTASAEGLRDVRDERR
jgi:peptide chain release factor 2